MLLQNAIQQKGKLEKIAACHLPYSLGRHVEALPKGQKTSKGKCLEYIQGIEAVVTMPS